MSDADRPPREWRFYITDMIEFAEKVLAYTKVWTRIRSLPTLSDTTRYCATSS